MNYSIIAATGNPGKLREIMRVLSSLNVSVSGLDRRQEIPPPEENGTTFAENARTKALYYARKTQELCLADDSGLVVDAIDGRPGVHSARFAADHCPPGADRTVIDRANNEKLLTLLKTMPQKERAARFVCHLALADQAGIVLESHGTIEGTIIDTPAGHNGFGYDPIFFVTEMGCTTAQLPLDQKNLISHRGKALRELAGKLAVLLRHQDSDTG